MTRSDQSVSGYDFFVEVSAEFGCAFLRGEVDVMDAEAIGVAVSPLVVVHERPAEVALDRDTFGDGAVQMGEVVAEIHDAVGVVDVTIGGEDVRGGASVFGDVDFFDVPELGGVSWAPVEGLGADGQPGTHHVRVRAGRWNHRE